MLLNINTEQWQLRWQQADTELAVVKGQSISASVWLKDIAAATHWLSEQDGDALLYHRDWYHFSVWLFALLNSERELFCQPMISRQRCQSCRRTIRSESRLNYLNT